MPMDDAGLWEPEDLDEGWPDEGWVSLGVTEGGYVWSDDEADAQPAWRRTPSPVRPVWAREGAEAETFADGEWAETVWPSSQFL